MKKFLRKNFNSKRRIPHGLAVGMNACRKGVGENCSFPRGGEQSRHYVGTLGTERFSKMKIPCALGAGRFIDSRGVSLLVAVLVTSVALIMSLAISRIALKEVLLTQASRNSQVAFYAANSGVECGLFEDLKGSPSAFNPEELSSIKCNDQDQEISGVEITANYPQACQDDEDFLVECWEIDMDGYINVGQSGDPCFNLKVFKGKFANSEVEEYFKTSLESRGYNTCVLDSPRRVERAIRVNY